MIPQLCNIYFNSEKNILSLDTLEDIKELAIKQYIGETSEVLKAIYLDNDCGYISCTDICCINNSTTVLVNVKKIIERAEKYNSSNIILMHNHPTGSTKPSKDDIFSTRKVEKMLNDLGLKLIDHIIVSKKEALSMRNTGYLL